MTLNADRLRELEIALHRREVRNSRRAVSELLADEFIEFGSSGTVYNKTQIIEALEKESVDRRIAVRDFAVKEIAPGVALITYISEREDPAGGDPASALRSSIWKLINGRWQMIFHQGTRMG